LDAELQLTGCFILFCSTMYTQVGPMISKGLNDNIKEIETNLKEVDTAVSQQIRNAIKENEAALTLTEDYKSVYQLVDHLSVAQAEVLNRAEEHKYRDQIVKKLDALNALEESATAAIRARTINAVKTEVVDLFKNDKKAKENALNAAIAVLTAGEGAKLGKDIVGEAFSQSLSAYKEKYAKQDPKSDAILVQLEKDIAAVATAPVVDGKAGSNVFVTHPIL
jgi:hypothetical protein